MLFQLCNDAIQRYTTSHTKVELGTLHDDPMAVVKQIYYQLGYTLSVASEEKMVAWLADNARGKHGKNTCV